MNENKEFKPYIPADKITPEFTVTSIIMGVILAVIFGAANAYLGLRVGMTVSASIPAAVISMGVIRKIMKKNSILRATWSRQSVQPVNHWQPVQFSQCLLCSFGQKKDFVKCRVSWKSH